MSSEENSCEECESGEEEEEEKNVKKVPDPLSIASTFENKISTFDADFASSAPDVDFVMPELERPYHLHTSTLSAASQMFAQLFKGKDFPFCKYDQDAHRIEWTDEKASSSKTYNSFVVKWLRFCYGEGMTMTVQEAPIALEILDQFQLQGSKSVKQTINDYYKPYEAEMKKKRMQAYSTLYQRHPEVRNADSLKARTRNWTVGDKITLLALLKENQIPLRELKFYRADRDFGQAFMPDDQGNPNRRTYSDMINQVLKVNTTLTSLYVEESDAKGGKGNQMICETLKSNTKIKRLALHGIDNEDDANAMADLVKNNSTLTTLDLCCSELCDDPAIIICKALKSNSSIKYLNLRLSHIYDEAGKPMNELLKVNSTITKLNLRGNDFGSPMVNEIANALENNSSLTWLDLSSNNFDNDGATNLGRALKTNHTLAWLNIGRNDFESSGIRELAEALKTNMSLTSLGLENIDLEPVGAKILSDGLRSNSTLLELFLGYTHLGDEGGVAIGNALRNNTVLQNLDVHGNEIHHNGTRAICDFLKASKSLTSLNLADHTIGKTRTAMICDALRVNQSLKTLYLEHNHIGDEQAKQLSSVLRTHKTLATVTLNNNWTREAGVAALRDAQKSNPVLKDLKVSVCDNVPECCIM